MLNLLHFAQASDTPLIIDNPPQPPVNDPTTTQLTGEQAEQAAGIFAGVGILFLFIGLLGLIFFILALIHLIKNPNVPNRTLWIVLVVLFGGLAGLIYYLGPRRAYDKSGSSGAPQANNGPTAQYQNPGVSPNTTGQAVGVGAPVASAPQQQPGPEKTSDYVSAAPTPVEPPVVAEPQPQVSAAPDNPVQVPPNPYQDTTSSSEQPSAPQVFSPEPPSQDVVQEPSKEEDSKWQNPNSQV